MATLINRQISCIDHTGLEPYLPGKKQPRRIPLGNGILLPKLIWPSVRKNGTRKNCSSDREKLLKFEAEGWEFANFWDH